MNFIEIFKDSLKYPTLDFKKLLILGILVMVCGIFTFLGTSSTNDNAMAILALISLIITLVVDFVIQGHIIDIIGVGITQKDEIPAINFKDDFVLGIKSFIVEIVYYIIPIILIIALIFLTGGFDYLVTILTNTDLNNIGDNVAIIFAGSIFFTVVVSVILVIIFSLVSIVAFGKLGKTGNLKEACSVGTIISETKKIGFLNMLAYIIVLMIIDFIILLISSIISILIPLVGFIIAALILMPYLLMFNARAMGLIYSKV
ncbi:DUF4013 domain-containing protein [Methanobrevibacter sp.]|uniref:DUF4013 domain-containing protein n=1 Tax=Methanobrevibacter sp. TaxID=66852 RepID=UPI003D7C4F56